MQVLLVGPTDRLPEGIGDELTQNAWTVDAAPDIESAAEKARRDHVDAVVVSGLDCPRRDIEAFLALLESERIAALLVGGSAHGAATSDSSLTDISDLDITKEEVLHRLDILVRFQKQLRRMEQELDHLQRLGLRLNEHFREIDEEMRLASRLQRDFLPLSVTEIGPLRFGTVYRPATWVSGDMFDIQRIDESHVGFYLADAVGHGMAAGLLTMFIKRAMVMKNISGDDYEVNDPGRSLKMLNDALAQYTLPNCQFVTAAHCVINTDTLEMRFARAGHPYPLHIQRDGSVVELKSDGGLLGLFDGFECNTCSVQLEPGDKVLLYSDGIEAAFDHIGSPDGTEGVGHRGVLACFAESSAAEMAKLVVDRLESEQGSLLPVDDVTVLAMEIVG